MSILYTNLKQLSTFKNIIIILVLLTLLVQIAYSQIEKISTRIEVEKYDVINQQTGEIQEIHVTAYLFQDFTFPKKLLPGNIIYVQWSDSGTEAISNPANTCYAITDSEGKIKLNLSTSNTINKPPMPLAGNYLIMRFVFCGNSNEISDIKSCTGIPNLNPYTINPCNNLLAGSTSGYASKLVPQYKTPFARSNTKTVPIVNSQRNRLMPIDNFLFCFTLSVIFALLASAMYVTGRNPFSAFDITPPRFKVMRLTDQGIFHTNLSLGAFTSRAIQNFMSKQIAKVEKEQTKTKDGRHETKVRIKSNVMKDLGESLYEATPTYGAQKVIGNINNTWNMAMRMVKGRKTINVRQKDEEDKKGQQQPKDGQVHQPVKQERETTTIQRDQENQRSIRIEGTLIMKDNKAYIVKEKDGKVELFEIKRSENGNLQLVHIKNQDELTKIFEPIKIKGKTVEVRIEKGQLVYYEIQGDKRTLITDSERIREINSMLKSRSSSYYISQSYVIDANKGNVFTLVERDNTGRLGLSEIRGDKALVIYYQVLTSEKNQIEEQLKQSISVEHNGKTYVVRLQDGKIKVFDGEVEVTDQKIKRAVVEKATQSYSDKLERFSSMLTRENKRISIEDAQALMLPKDETKKSEDEKPKSKRDSALIEELRLLIIPVLLALNKQPFYKVMSHYVFYRATHVMDKQYKNSTDTLEERLTTKGMRGFTGSNFIDTVTILMATQHLASISGLNKLKEVLGLSKRTEEDSIMERLNKIGESMGAKSAYLSVAFMEDLGLTKIGFIRRTASEVSNILVENSAKIFGNLFGLPELKHVNFNSDISYNEEAMSIIVLSAHYAIQYVRYVELDKYFKQNKDELKDINPIEREKRSLLLKEYLYLKSYFEGPKVDRNYWSNLIRVLIFLMIMNNIRASKFRKTALGQTLRFIYDPRLGFARDVFNYIYACLTANQFIEREVYTLEGRAEKLAILISQTNKLLSDTLNENEKESIMNKIIRTLESFGVKIDLQEFNRNSGDQKINIIDQKINRIVDKVYELLLQNQDMYINELAIRHHNGNVDSLIAQLTNDANQKTEIQQIIQSKDKPQNVPEDEKKKDFIRKRALLSEKLNSYLQKLFEENKAQKTTIIVNKGYAKVRLGADSDIVGVMPLDGLRYWLSGYGEVINRSYRDMVLINQRINALLDYKLAQNKEETKMVLEQKYKSNIKEINELIKQLEEEKTDQRKREELKQDISKKLNELFSILSDDFVTKEEREDITKALNDGNYEALKNQLNSLLTDSGRLIRFEQNIHNRLKNLGITLHQNSDIDALIERERQEMLKRLVSFYYGVSMAPLFFQPGDMTPNKQQFVRTVGTKLNEMQKAAILLFNNLVLNDKAILTSTSRAFADYLSGKIDARQFEIIASNPDSIYDNITRTTIGRQIISSSNVTVGDKTLTEVVIYIKSNKLVARKANGLEIDLTESVNDGQTVKIKIDDEEYTISTKKEAESLVVINNANQEVISIEFKTGKIKLVDPPKDEAKRFRLAQIMYITTVLAKHELVKKLDSSERELRVLRNQQNFGLLITDEETILKILKAFDDKTDQDQHSSIKYIKVSQGTIQTKKDEVQQGEQGWIKVEDIEYVEVSNGLIKIKLKDNKEPLIIQAQTSIENDILKIKDVNVGIDDQQFIYSANSVNLSETATKKIQPMKLDQHSYVKYDSTKKCYMFFRLNERNQLELAHTLSTLDPTKIKLMHFINSIDQTDSATRIIDSFFYLLGDERFKDDLNLQTLLINADTSHTLGLLEQRKKVLSNLDVFDRAEYIMQTLYLSAGRNLPRLEQELPFSSELNRRFAELNDTLYKELEPEKRLYDRLNKILPGIDILSMDYNLELAQQALIRLNEETFKLQNMLIDKAMLELDPEKRSIMLGMASDLEFLRCLAGIDKTDFGMLVEFNSEKAAEQVDFYARNFEENMIKINKILEDQAKQNQIPQDQKQFIQDNLIKLRKLLAYYSSRINNEDLSYEERALAAARIIQIGSVIETVLRTRDVTIFEKLSGELEKDYSVVQNEEIKLQAVSKSKVKSIFERTIAEGLLIHGISVDDALKLKDNLRYWFSSAKSNLDYENLMKAYMAYKIMTKNQDSTQVTYTPYQLKLLAMMSDLEEAKKLDQLIHSQNAQLLFQEALATDETIKSHGLSSPFSSLLPSLFYYSLNNNPENLPTKSTHDGIQISDEAIFSYLITDPSNPQSKTTTNSEHIEIAKEISVMLYNRSKKEIEERIDAFLKKTPIITQGVTEMPTDQNNSLSVYDVYSTIRSVNPVLAEFILSVNPDYYEALAKKYVKKDEEKGTTFFDSEKLNKALQTLVDDMLVISGTYDTYQRSRLLEQNFESVANYSKAIGGSGLSLENYGVSPDLQMSRIIQMQNLGGQKF
ncbi:MAG: hypothetical protein N3E37_00880 [Candidatus Micrarchaeota archaeon]|nr:hypothetical protein [Candidatus Micrarchaeota archaeon]